MASMYNIEKLNKTNWSSWKMRMEAIFFDRELDGIVDGTEEKPDDPEALKKWKRKNGNALSQITLCVADSEINHIKQFKTAKEAWDKLTMINQAKGLAAKVHLRRELYSTRLKEGDSMQSHLNHIRELVIK